MEGIITPGLGEGYLFMSMKYYKTEIKKKLGFEAYPGTLNLRVKEDKSVLLKNFIPIRIEGYKDGEKTFCGINCYKAKINDINGYLIIPDINKHKENILEFIATINIKSELKINDGDRVKIQLINF